MKAEERYIPENATLANLYFTVANLYEDKIRSLLNQRVKEYNLSVEIMEEESRFYVLPKDRKDNYSCECVLIFPQVCIGKEDYLDIKKGEILVKFLSKIK